MPQVFRPRSNAVFKLVLLGSMGGVVTLGILGDIQKWSPWATGRDVALEQPVPFSHRHHVSGLGLDCRYCHASVEVAPNAGMPPLKTCMACHSQIWTQATMLEPLRAGFKSGRPIQWSRVYRLQDYVYFDHSIHVSKGIGCSSCHGRIDQMPLTRKARDFYMKDCLECHRRPEKYIRPVDQVFNQEWQAPPDQLKRGRELVRRYQIPKERLTDCYTCHR